MSAGTKYYKRRDFSGYRWVLCQRDVHGDRVLACGMSEKTASRIVRLMNAEDAASVPGGTP